MPKTASRDPRSIITPDALVVSDHLIGTPLASPRRRAAALALDGLVILFITALTSNFGLILGVIIAVLFVRAGFKRTPVKGSVFGRAMRFSVGCLGVVIALATAALWVTFGADGGRDLTEALEAPGAGGESAAQVLAALAASGVLSAVDLGDTRADAIRTANDFIEASGELGLGRGPLRSALVGSVDPDVDWASGWAATVDSLFDAAAQLPPAPSEGASAIRAEVDALSDDEALLQYAALLAAGDDDDTAAVRGTLLRARLSDLVAGDSLRALERQVDRLRDDVEDAEDDLERTAGQLRAAEARSIGSRIWGLADDLGFGFGWAGLYLTVILSWWNGQTVGKRLMGIRVVRLDGGLITWWVAFERAGGYAAGLFTGLLGFAQVWWDANRQAIHDRIVGTVVVYDKAEKVLDWENAL
jgi:hypothetical protein